MEGTRHTRAGIVPTYVGVNRLIEFTAQTITDCPHVCGGEPTAYKPYDLLVTLSPRMWG